MDAITIRNLTFGYDGGEPLFDGFDLDIGENWRLGLIGRNGRGKTTFLKLLNGELEYTGSIRVPFNTVRLLPDPVGETAIEAARQYGGEDWAIAREAALLGIAACMDRPLDSLSGGQRTKAQLAGLFATEAYPLIDEPTDSLDLEGRRAVAAYLAKKNGFILASHDRAFLDACTDKTMSLNKTGAEAAGCGCSEYLRNLFLRQACERGINDRLEKDIERLNTAAAELKRRSMKAEKEKFGVQKCGLKADRGAAGRKAAKLMQSARNTERRLRNAAEEKRSLLLDAEYDPEVKLCPLCYRSERLIELKRFSVGYDGGYVLRDLDLVVRRGERLAVSGLNGCGKSTLLKALAGAGGLRTEGGLYKSGDLVVSYLAQRPELRGRLRDHTRDEPLVRALLHRMGFSRREAEADLERMSTGQRKKVALALSLAARAHLYVWDEPLNYVDIISREQIERLILTYAPTLVFVEHDADFVARTATDTLCLD